MLTTFNMFGFGMTAMVCNSPSVMSKEFHISAEKFRVVLCPHLL